MADESKSSTADDITETLSSTELNAPATFVSVREFTPEERAAQLVAQREEEAAAAKEANELLEEQKRVSAQIKARRVGFMTTYVVDGANGSAASSSPSIAFQTSDDASDYDFHHHQLVRVLFVENECDALAPIAAAFIRKFQAHVIQSSVAAVSIVQPLPPLQPVALTTMEEINVDLKDSATAPVRHSLTSLATRPDAKFKFVITLDDASKSAFSSLPSGGFGGAKLIHQPFTRPTDTQTAETTRQAIKTFIEELPDLLSFYA